MSGGIGITPLGVEVMERCLALEAKGIVVDDAMLEQVTAEVKMERSGEHPVGYRDTKPENVPTARIVAPDQIVVEGGAKGIPLPPAVEYDGKVDPKLAEQVEIGKVRYHLHTLEELDKESRAEVIDIPETPEMERQRKARQAVMTTLSMAAVLATVGIRVQEDEPAPSPPKSGEQIKADALEFAQEYKRQEQSAASAQEAARAKRARKAAARLVRKP